MKKLIGLLVLGGVAFAVFMAWKRQSAESRPSMVEKMQQKMKAMPDDFPPVVMFNNVAATRENTERILELLEKSGATEESSESDAAEEEST